MLIKVRFIKNGSPSGREYTYRSEIKVEINDAVELPGGGIGVVTGTNVPESEVKSYAEKIKDIIGLKERGSDDSKGTD